MSPIERYEDGELVEYRSSVPTVAMATGTALMFGAMAFSYLSVYQPPVSAPQGAEQPAAPAVTNSAISFPGYQDADSGRAEVRFASDSTDPTAHPLNVGDSDLTIHFWLRFDSLENETVAASSEGCNTTGSIMYTESHVFLDWDRTTPLAGGFGVGAARDALNSNAHRVVFTVQNQTGTASASVCTNVGANIGDNQWHEYMVTRDLSTGAIAIYFDGTRHGTATGFTGTMQLPLTDDASGANGLFTIGNEKHDTFGFLAFTGDMDELEISNTLRQTGASYTACTVGCRQVRDQWTAAIFHFDESGVGEFENFDAVTWDSTLVLGDDVTYLTGPTATDDYGVEFAMDWRTGLTSAAASRQDSLDALTDNGLLSGSNCDTGGVAVGNGIAQVLRVGDSIASLPAALDSLYGMRVSFNDTDNASCDLGANQWNLPAIGDTLFTRVLLVEDYNASQQSTPNSDHGYQSGNAGDTCQDLVYQDWYNALGFAVGAVGTCPSTWPSSGNAGYNMDLGRVHYLEAGVVRQTADTVEITHMNVFDSTGTIVATIDSLCGTASDWSCTGSNSLASHGRFAISDTLSLRTHGFGASGSGGGQNQLGALWRTVFCVRINVSCGVYPNAGENN